MSVCLTRQQREWLTIDNLGRERKGELAKSENSKPDETWLTAHTVDNTVSSLYTVQVSLVHMILPIIHAR